MSESDRTGLKPQVYLDPRPAEYFDRFHARARTRQPDWVYPLLRVISWPYVRLAFRLRVQALEQVPATGPVILAPNHFSAMDHWFVGIALSRRLRFMAKSQLFRAPLLGVVISHLGAFPVRRGRRDVEAITTAQTILRQDGVLVMYPEGGRSRSAQIGSSARPGIGRLALDLGVPVVPVAIHGSERARNWRWLRFPPVTVRYGAPLRFAPEPEASHERHQQVADEVLATVHALHDELVAAAGPDRR